MIIKIQRSLSTSDEQERVLVYDQPRHFCQEFPMTDELRDLFLPNELKIYCTASFRDGTLAIGEHLPPQDF